MLGEVLRYVDDTWCVVFASRRGNKSFSFFFQAEDGIQDLVRSRGLGYVYRRQQQVPIMAPHYLLTVPYTHLTLPTIDPV